MLALVSRSFVTNKYSNHHSVDVQDTNNIGYNKYNDMSQKGNIKTKSTPSNRSKEKIMYYEILSLSTSFTETPKRNFDNNTYWDILSLVTTKLGEETCSRNNIKTIKIAASIFDNSKKSNSEQTVDYSLLDDNVMSALNGDILNTGEGDVDAGNNEDDVVNSEDSCEVEIIVNNEIGSKSTKVNKGNSSVDDVTFTLWLNILAAIKTSSIFLIIIGVEDLLLLIPKTNRLHPRYCLFLSNGTGTNVISPLTSLM